jgi:transposase InsO family protein
MPYGVTGGPATFQQTMNYILAPLLRKGVVVFIDDILIYSSTWDQHLHLLHSVFQLLSKHHIKIKLSKCSFAQSELKYLGHIISARGVATDPKKVADVQNWPIPTTVKEVRSFLGLAGYYRKFVQHFGTIARPLTELLKKGHIFQWTSAHDIAFNQLKQALVTAPVLHLPDFSKSFIIETDASAKGIGAVLQQDGHPIAYISKALGPKNQGLSTYEKECLAILMAVDHWRAYLHHAPFTIKTDQRSLESLTDQRLITPWQLKAFTKLLGLQYHITYKKGTENSAADALSRLPLVPSNTTVDFYALSTSQSVWLQDLVNTYPTHPSTAKLLAALTISSPQAWQVISMDFIEGLPSSKGYNCILVVVDKFSKYAHFIALAHPFTALQVAKVFVDQVYRLHGLPSAIISDRDKVFTSALWKELFRMTQTDLLMSTAYHPQTDGQTERVNQCLEGYLRCAVHACPTKWKDWLPLAEFWYNSSYHSSLNKTPFEVLYGNEPRHFGIDHTQDCAVPDLETWLSQRKLMEQLLQQHLIRVQQRQKAQADKNRTERQFQVGQMVFVKLQPYVQTSVAQRINQKLSFRYFGPFPVIQRIGQVAYKLQLPPTSAIHPVFHVSQLKLAIGPGHPVSSELPDSTSSSQYPVKILQRRRKRHNAQLIDQILVQWSSWPKHLTTWEDEITLKATFPRAPAWGQAGSQGGRNVTTSAASDVVPGEETTEADEVVELSKGPGVKTRPKRTVKPNMKYIGPSWTNPSSKKAEA